MASVSSRSVHKSKSQVVDSQRLYISHSEYSAQKIHGSLKALRHHQASAVGQAVARRWSRHQMASHKERIPAGHAWAAPC